MPIVQNFPGPYEVRIYYTTTPVGFPAITHSSRFSCQIQGTPAAGLPFTSYSAFPLSGAVIPLNTVVDNWVALLRPLLSTGGGNTVDYAELWKYTPGTFSAVFMSSYSIALPGLSGGSVFAAGQLIQTYRTYEGGIFKVSVMESTVVSSGIDSPPFTPAAAENMRGGIIGASNCWIGKDTSYPLAAIGQYAGQNEALFKKRYR